MSDQIVIKVGMMISYDWQLMKRSLPRIYDRAEKLCLAKDKNNRTWSCQDFDFDEDAFNTWLDEVDTEKKIEIYLDDFALKDLNARENGNRQRTMMAEFMGKDGWHIQVDSDEYFFDFNGYVDYLLAFNPAPKHTDKPINMLINWIPVIKKIDEGFLIVDFPDGKFENAPLASNHPVYERARQNGHFNHLTNFFVLHETWSRENDELWQKFNSWGHSVEEFKDERSKQKEFDWWKELNVENYKSYKNFHESHPDIWPRMELIPAQSIEELMEMLANLKNLNIPASRRFFKNSRNVARLVSLFK